MKNQVYPLHEILFLDIETVSQSPSFSELNPLNAELWEEKSAYFRERNETSLEDSYERAGIYAEFGKVVCIGVGYFYRSRDGEELRIASFTGHDEVELLRSFCDFLNRSDRNPFRLLCAHNGKEFDFPYLCRRMIIHGIALPRLLKLSGLKPWEVPHLDTMEMWKFGDYKHYTSLRLMAGVLGVADSKDDIDGSMVGRVYWEEKDLDRIDRYCRKDVVTLARVFQRLTGTDAISEDQVVMVQEAQRRPI